MAITVDKGRLQGVDKPYRSPNRTVTSTPVNSLAAKYKGEIVEYNAAGVTQYWKATSIEGTTVWVQLIPSGALL